MADPFCLLCDGLRFQSFPYFKTGGFVCLLAARSSSMDADEEFSPQPVHCALVLFA